MYLPFYENHKGNVLIAFYDESKTYDLSFRAYDQYGGVTNVSTELSDDLEIIFVVPDNLNFPEALPWHKCYCTRGTDREMPDGSIIHTSRGTCDAGKNDDHCGQCGNADFWGTCPGGSCAGC